MTRILAAFQRAQDSEYFYLYPLEWVRFKNIPEKNSDVNRPQKAGYWPLPTVQLLLLGC